MRSHKPVPPKHTPEMLRAKFLYDAATGILTWRPIPDVGRYDKQWNTRWVGKAAGSATSLGYVIVCVDRTRYFAHRIAWAIHYGEWPEMFLDHINRDGMDNRIDNLRLATHAQNMANASVRSDNTSGYRGVSKDYYTDKWRAQISVDGKVYVLGLFPTKDAAFTAYCEAGKELRGEHFRPAQQTS